MAKQTVGIGSAANDGTGDTLRAGADKINDNFIRGIIMRNIKLFFLIFFLFTFKNDAQSLKNEFVVVVDAGHGGKSGRDGTIEEIALDYAFALKISKKI